MVNYCIYTIFSKSPAKLLLFLFLQTFSKKTKKKHSAEELFVYIITFLYLCAAN